MDQVWIKWWCITQVIFVKFAKCIIIYWWVGWIACLMDQRVLSSSLPFCAEYVCLSINIVIKRHKGELLSFNCGIVNFMLIIIICWGENGLKLLSEIDCKKKKNTWRRRGWGRVWCIVVSIPPTSQTCLGPSLSFVSDSKCWASVLSLPSRVWVDGVPPSPSAFHLLSPVMGWISCLGWLSPLLYSLLCVLIVLPVSRISTQFQESNCRRLESVGQPSIFSLTIAILTPERVRDGLRWLVRSLTLTNHFFLKSYPVCLYF